MYIAEKERKALMPRIVDLDMLTRQELVDGLKAQAMIQLRIEHVTIVAANLFDELRLSDKAKDAGYKWYFRDYVVETTQPHQDWREASVRARVYASRRHDEDDVPQGSYEDWLVHIGRGGHVDSYGDSPDYLIRTVTFPTRWLYETEWLEEARLMAAKQAKFWVDKKAEEAVEAVAKREQDLQEARNRAAQYDTDRDLFYAEWPQLKEEDDA